MLTIVRETNDNPHFSECLNAIVLDNFLLCGNSFDHCISSGKP